MSEKDPEMKSTKPGIHDYHNQELVSKLIAATPSYLYAPPSGPHTFFFSELLRSLVQKRKIEELNPMKAKQFMKKMRKPNVYPHPVENEWKRQRTNSPIPTKPRTPEASREEEQLDLSKNYQNDNENPKSNSPNSEDNFRESSEPPINVDKDDDPPPSVPVTSTSNPTTLPPPILPAWYQPGMPFYDPLHFFIDLRVSGHIYDRKKDYLHQALKSNNILLDSNTWNPSSIIGKNRVGSAFKVPNSIQESNNYNSINLTTNGNNNQPTPHLVHPEKSPLNFDYYDSKENKDLPSNTNYVMQNLPNIYKKLYTKPENDDERADTSIEEIDRNSESDKNSDVEVIFDLDVKLEQKK
jgi:hypothetical protein